MNCSQETYDSLVLPSLCRPKELADDRREVLTKIACYEREGRFDQDVENDPPTIPLNSEKVDYLGEKLWSRMKTAIANKLGYAYFSRMIKKELLVTENIIGRKYLSALDGGAVITCNHFAAYDNFIVYKALEHDFPKGRLYKIVREGNYTSFPGLYGFLFRNCNTLPLSSDVKGAKALLKATDVLLSRGESVLIYPEQAMWWNYRKPRPFKSGGFRMAYKAGVPVLPVFITMRDGNRLGADGYPVQLHTLHILPPVYPDAKLSPKEGADAMRDKVFASYVQTYEKVYGTAYDL